MPCDLTTLLCPQLYGYCYQDSEGIPDMLTTITELGTPVDMIQLLQTAWEDRFRVRLPGHGNRGTGSIGLNAVGGRRCEPACPRRSA